MKISLAIPFPGSAIGCLARSSPKMRYKKSIEHIDKCNGTSILPGNRACDNWPCRVIPSGGICSTSRGAGLAVRVGQRINQGRLKTGVPSDRGGFRAIIQANRKGWFHSFANAGIAAAAWGA